MSVMSIASWIKQVLARQTVTSLFRQLKQGTNPPEPVDGKEINIDTGHERTVVVTVEANGEKYYETYELKSVDSSKPSR